MSGKIEKTAKLHIDSSLATSTGNITYCMYGRYPKLCHKSLHKLRDNFVKADLHGLKFRRESTSFDGIAVGEPVEVQMHIDYQ